MKMGKYYIGVDIGTTSTKTVIYGENAEIISTHHVEYPLYSPVPDFAEQDPEEIFWAVVNSIKGAIDKEKIPGKNIEFVSLSAAMHSLMAVDRHGIPLTKCITWADQRAAKWAEKVKGERLGRELYERTGTPIHPMAPLAKIVWIKEVQPAIFSNTYKFISVKEYILHKLFGVYLVDYSIASSTGLFNIKEFTWDREALSVAGISEERLSEPVSTSYILRGLKQEYAIKIGLSPDTPFVIGASDGVLSNLGVNAIRPGDVAVTIGTSGAIRTVTNRPVTDPKGRIFCYVLTENQWVIGGPVNNGGIALRWLRDVLENSKKGIAGSGDAGSYGVLTQIASKAQPGSDGLIFIPYLTGERAPLWNANAKAAFFGLGIHHRKEHIIRSVMEGVIFNLYAVMMAIREIIGEPKTIRATGGFARSDLWRQMLADIFNLEVIVPQSFESSCLGAVILGMYAFGKIHDFSDVSKWIGITHIHKPIPKNVEIYQELIPIFLNVSKALEGEYGKIREFQKKWIQ